MAAQGSGRAASLNVFSARSLGVGVHGLRDTTHVAITETPSGERAVGGQPLTAEHVKQKRTSGSAA